MQEKNAADNLKHKLAAGLAVVSGMLGTYEDGKGSEPGATVAEKES